MMQMLTKVPAINKEAYTSFGSSSNVTIRLAAGCCFVFSIFISLFSSENNATTPPDITNVIRNNTTSIINRKVVPWGLIASRKNLRSFIALNTEWLSKAKGFVERLIRKAGLPACPCNYVSQRYYLNRCF